MSALGGGRWWRGRRPVLVLVLVAVLGAALLVTSAMRGALTYYRTPSELEANPVRASTSVRLGGLVVAGSVKHHGRTISFTLTDGADDLEVVSSAQPPGTFRAGQGAVVQGHLARDGVFHADQIIVRHSDEYQPPRDLSS